MFRFRKRRLPFHRDRTGSLPMVLAAAMFPLVGLTGGAIDYGRSIMDRTRLDSALDAAMIAASRAAQMADQAGMSDDAIKQRAQLAAVAVFYSTPKLPMFSFPPPTVTIENRTVSVVGSYSSATKSTLLNVIGIKQFAQAGNSQALVDLSPSVDIHLLIDVSGSMALGAKQSDIDRLQNEFGCAFACHDGEHVKNTSMDAYEWAVSNGIELRLHEINKGIVDFVEWLKKQGSSTKRLRIATYSFSTTLDTLVPITSNLSAAETNLPKAPATADEYGGSTHFKELMPRFGSSLGTAGDGKTSPKKLVIIATDGVQDPTRAWVWDDSLRPQVAPFSPSDCRNIHKSVSVGVPYAPYLPMPWDWGYEATLGERSQIGNSGTRLDDIVPQLKGCATSPDLFVDLSKTKSVGDAFVSIFQRFTQIRFAR